MNSNKQTQNTMDFETITYPLPLEDDRYIHHGVIMHCSRLIEKKVRIPRSPASEFLGLYFNLQNTLHYRAKTLPAGRIKKNQYNLVYVPAQSCEITLLAGPYTSFCIEFAPELLDHFTDSFPMLTEFLEKVKQQAPALVIEEHCTITPEILGIIDGILTNRFTGSFREVFLKARFVSLLIHCLEHILKHYYRGLDKADIEKIRKAHDYILRDIRYNYSVEVLAEKVGLKKRTLGSGFAALYGTSVTNFIVNERMKKALDLLRDTTLTVGEIAASVGYDRITTFSDTFRRKFGYAPRDARKGQG